jgi:prephenate dehydrogenase
MNDPDSFFAGQRVVIIGLGLMGGSLAFALRKHVKELLAIDPDPATQVLALEQRMIDRFIVDLEEIIDQVDVIILAAPVSVIIEYIRRLGEIASRSRSPVGVQRSTKPIVLDLGSTKREITEAMKALPEQFDPIGGHPMCGKETSGLVHADAEIYHGAAFAFTPLERTSPQARAFAIELAAIVGALPLWIDPDLHDRWVAATSHLPYLVASALAGVTPLETAPLVGPGFRSTSRLAATSLPVMLDVLQTNRQPVLEALHRFRTRVEVLENLLTEGDFSALSGLLASAAQCHQSLVRTPDVHSWRSWL